MSRELSWSTLQHTRLSRRRWLRTATAGGVGLAAIGLAGCSSGKTTSGQAGGAASTAAQASQGTPQRGGFLNATPTDRPFPLDPQKLSASPQKVVGGVYSRLLRYKAGLDPNTIADHNTEGDLALSLESPDAVTWTAKLRSDARFHDIAPVNGRAVDSEDVKATFTRALDPATGNPNRGVLDMIDPTQITTPDKQTVVFKLNYPYAPFPNIAGSPAYSLILSREVLTSLDPATVVIGSGPFILDSAAPDVAYTYKRNPNWFEKGLPYLDGYKIPVIPTAATQLAQFAAGNLDELILTDPYQVDTVRGQNPKATMLKADYSSANPLYFQMGDPASQFLDVRVRRAFSLAIDRDAISKSVYNGQTDLMVYIPGYMGKWAMKVSDLPQDTQQYYKYDPAAAKKLLSAAGFSEVVIQLAYMTTSPSGIKHVEAIGNMLNAIGVKTTLVAQDYNKDFVDEGHGSRQGFFPKNMVGWFNQAAYSDADQWLFTYFASRSTSNQEHLKDPTYDALIDKQRTQVNEPDRVKAIRDILTYFADKMYAPNSVAPPEWIGVQPRIRNYQFSSTLGVGTESYAKLWIAA